MKHLLKNSYKKYRDIFIKELNCQLVEYTHRSNAKIIHLKTDDPDNLFCISLKTIPKDSKGAPHILEHIVFCGSEKFKVKDPFFYMRRRSLNTFMNAMTGSDFTCYPASSEIPKDFYNLLEVYIDAIFHPLLTKESFLQEGHRLEFIDQNIKNMLKYKGVVFNEMKGADSLLEQRLYHKMLKELTPDLPYAFNSGGEPKKILKLTYSELLKFHKKYYHPSRATFFFYGNIETEKHLNFLEKHILSKTEKTQPIKSILKQKKFSKPKNFISYYPSLEEDLAAISFGWLFCDISNQKDALALTLLDSILMQTDASLLKYEILKSNLCQHADSLIDLEMSQIPYMIILRGVKKENKEKLLSLIFKTLKTIKIPKSLINAAFSKLEFTKTEISRNHIPYGLELFFRSCLANQHGCNIESSLKIHSAFKALKKDLKDPNFFKKLINKYFLKNPHLVKLTMLPDKNLSKKEEIKEQESLKKIKRKLSSSQKKEILKQAALLKKNQKKKESIISLPNLSLKDIPKNPKNYPLIKNKNIYFYKTFTNEILYANLIFDVPKLKKEDLFYLSFFTSILDELGCGKRNYKQNLEYINSYIGGITANTFLNPQIKTLKCKPLMALEGKVLKRNEKRLFSLLKDLATSLNLKEKNRIKELIIQQYSILESSLNKDAYNYGILNTLSFISSAFFVNNQLHGYEYYQKLKKFSLNIDNFIDEIIVNLKKIKKIFSHKKPDLVITYDNFPKDIINPEIFPKNPQENWSCDFKLPSNNWEGKIIPSSVAFNSMGFKTIGGNHKDSPYIYLSTYILENKTLHPIIREQQGAYGSSAMYSPRLGGFYFYSYRDPHISNTINTFENSIKNLTKGNFNKQDLEEAKFQAIQKLDKLYAPGKKAMKSYLEKRSKRKYKDNKEFREKLLNAKKEDIQKAAEKHLKTQIKNSKVTSFSNENHLSKESKYLKKNLYIQKI